MIVILQTTFSNVFCCEKVSYCVLNCIEVFPMCTFKYQSVLKQMMAWCQTGDRPFSAAMVANYTDAYMRHLASMG